MALGAGVLIGLILAHTGGPCNMSVYAETKVNIVNYRKFTIYLQPDLFPKILVKSLKGSMTKIINFSHLSFWSDAVHV